MGGGKLCYFCLRKVLILLYSFSKCNSPLFYSGLVSGFRIMCEDAKSD